MIRCALAALAAIVMLAGACRSQPEPEADIRLDGSPRIPDRAGVVTAVSLREITVDRTSIPLSRKLRAFSTYTLAAMPVLQTKGAYVHVGVKSGKVVWLAEVAKLLPAPGGKQQTAFYTGTVAKTLPGKQVAFADGTVLELSDGLAPPPAKASVLAEIDPTKDTVVKVSGA